MSKLEEGGLKLVDILEKAGYTAFFAGGYVRDKIMKRKVHDIDIATSAKPEEIKKIFEKKKIKYIEIGEKFGVIAALIPKSKNKFFTYEIATFRQDFGTDNSRHPKKVKLISDPKEDAIRRDFTINGMFLGTKTNDYIAKLLHCQDTRKPSQQYNNSTIQQSYCLKKEGYGIVIDFVNGLHDIESKTIRFIGDPNERIKEDALRMMRALRFSVQLGFEIEEKSFIAIKKNKDLIKKISYERVRDELNKMLSSDKKRLAMDLLYESGILEIVLPEIVAGKGIDQPTNMHYEGDVWNHTLLSLSKIRKQKQSDPVFAWAVLLHDVGKPITVQTPEKDHVDRIRFSGHDSEGAKLAESILRRLKFSNDEIKKISWLIKYHMLFGNFSKMRESTRIRYLADPNFSDLLELFWVDANSSVRSTPRGKVLPPDLTGYNKALRAFKKEKGKPKLPKPILRGDDVMKMMGIKSGNKEVGDILREVYDAQLEKKVKSKAEAKKLAEKLLKKKK